ncbi:MAG: TetR/AcrR family transcriptional regulator [Spirochaetes bacterium]|nr:TetR/AcrR family transcriptional regulator [Spirochaetota bacterium]
MEKKTRPKRAYMSKALRKEEIVAKAKAVFAEKGYHNTSIGDILKACNIAQGTLYMHFSGKQEVFREVIIDAMGNILKIISPIQVEAMNDAQSRDLDLYHYILRKNRRFFEAVRDEKNLFRIILFESYGIDPEINKILLNIYNIIKNQVETELSIFRKLDLLGDVNMMIAVQAVIGSIMMVIMNNFFGDAEPDIPYLAEEITKLQLYGYGNGHHKGGITL